jgi:hypothetical protein
MVFWEFVEQLETRIARRVSWDSHGLFVLCDPSSDALADAQPQAIHNLDFRMRVLRAAQDQIIAFQDVDEARIAFDQGGNEVDDLPQHFVQRIRCCEAAGDRV